MKEKSIKKNFVFNLFYQVLILVAPLIVTPYVSRVLGVDGVGEYSYAHSIVSYFLLFAVLGTATYGQRTIGYNQQNKEDRSRAFWEVFICRIITSGVTLAAYALYVFVFVPQSGLTLYLILAINIFNVIVDVSWFMQGMEEFGITATTSIIFRIMNIVSVFLFVKSPDDLWIYVLITVGYTVLGNMVMWAFLHKYLCRVSGIKPFKDIKTILQLFLPTIAIQIYVVVDKSMIGWFSNGYTENGYYEQADKIVKIALTAVTALGIVMIPRISRNYKAGNMEQVKGYIYKSYRYVWMAAIPIMLGLIVVSDIFVPIFFGSGYEKCAILIPILSALTVFIGLSNVTGLQYFVPVGKQNVLTLTVVIGAVVNVAVNSVLIPFFSSIGAAVASLVAEFCVTLTGLIYIKRKRMFELKPIFGCSWKYWLSGGIMMGLLYLIKYFLPTAAWSLIVLIVTGMVLYFAALLIFRDAFVFEILTKSFAAVGRVFRRKNAVSQSISETDSLPASDSLADAETPINPDAEAPGEVTDSAPCDDNAVQEAYVADDETSADSVSM